MRISLFKLDRPKRFSYKPRHFDPVLEDLHSRIKIKEAELVEDDTDTSEMARNRIRKAWKTPETRNAANKSSTVKTALIAAVLFALFYIYFFTDFIS